MESASLGLLSKEPEDLWNVIHILNIANYVKKKEGQEEETGPGISRLSPV